MTHAAKLAAADEVIRNLELALRRCDEHGVAAVAGAHIDLAIHMVKRERSKLATEIPPLRAAG